jgi:hypothetical protein
VDRAVDTPGVSALLHGRVDRGGDRLLAHCAGVSRSPDRRKPVLERLREKMGGELTGLLLFGLGAQRGRSDLPG